MDIVEKIDMVLGEAVVPMTRRKALDRIETSTNKDEIGWLVRVANVGGATSHELKAALDGKEYTMYKGSDINKEKRWK